MTFNEWLEKEYPRIYTMKDSHGVQHWILMAENAWKAAINSGPSQRHTNTDKEPTFLGYNDDGLAVYELKTGFC